MKKSKGRGTKLPDKPMGAIPESREDIYRDLDQIRRQLARAEHPEVIRLSLGLDEKQFRERMEVLSLNARDFSGLWDTYVAGCNERISAADALIEQNRQIINGSNRKPALPVDPGRQHQARDQIRQCLLAQQTIAQGLMQIAVQLGFLEEMKRKNQMTEEQQLEEQARRVLKVLLDHDVLEPAGGLPVPVRIDVVDGLGGP